MSLPQEPIAELPAAHSRPIPDGFHCPGCGYDLSGGPAVRCPECGRACTKADLEIFDIGLPDRTRFLRRWALYAAPGWLLIAALAVGVAARWIASALPAWYVLGWFAAAALLTWPGISPRRQPHIDAVEVRASHAVWLMLAPIMHLPWAFVAAQRLLGLASPATPLPVAYTFGFLHMVTWLAAPLIFLAAWRLMDQSMSLRPTGTTWGLRVVFLAMFSALSAIALALTI